MRQIEERQTKDLKVIGSNHGFITKSFRFQSTVLLLIMLLDTFNIIKVPLHRQLVVNDPINEMQML